MNAIHLPYTHHCFVCGADNVHGLQLRFRVEAGEIRSDFCPREHHAGYRGMVHGGVIASALDETMFWAAAYATREFHVSVAMEVRYRQKVAVGEPYHLVARLAGKQKRICLTAAELRTATGELCASATGRFFPLRPSEVPLSHADFCADPATLSVAEFLPVLPAG
jgi:acyl-coenzyme A thioesterase PaaI-like protein